MIRALSSEPVNGRWLISGLMGRGSAATVFRGFDLVEERLVAIKAFGGGRRQEAGRANRSLLGRVRREFVDLARIRHPNLVEAYELGVAASGPLASGTPFFTMELLDETLRARCGTNEAGARAERLAQAAHDILRALECVHAHGLVHNDIKPANVLLRSEAGAMRAKLGDFGLAADPSRARRSCGALSGTIPYASPEAITGETTDPRSDLYSLGVTLFEAATGTLPFETSDPAALLAWLTKANAEAMAEEASETTSELGRALPILERLMGRLLETRRERRHRSAREAREELEDAMPELGEASSAPDPGPEGLFVGRSREIAHVERWLEDATGAGLRLRIGGPAGCGLTRLAREIAVRAIARGTAVHAWTCSAADQPFAPLRRPLREIILGSCAGAATSLRPNDREILTLLGGPALWSAPPDLWSQVPASLARAIAAFMLGRRPDRPLLLVLDDAERCDEGTARVLEALCDPPRQERPPLRVVILERSSDPDGRGSAKPDSLWIGPLSHAAARSMLNALPGFGHTRSRDWGRSSGPSSDQSRGQISGRSGIRNSGRNDFATLFLEADARLPRRLRALAQARSSRQPSLFPPLYEPARGYRVTSTSSALLKRLK